MKKSVPNLMREAADVYEERHKQYGDNYKQFGKVMVALFPEGLKLRSVEDWNRMGVFIQSVSKMTRYSANFERGGHDDSLLDGSVYLNMLRELEAEAKAAGIGQTTSVIYEVSDEISDS